MKKTILNNKIKKQAGGFTLIEMTIVLFIISLLILIIIPNLSNQRKHAQGIHANAMVSVVQSQFDAYETEFPNQSKVTLIDLQKKGYLSQKQLKEAQASGIKIKNNEVVK